jgi:molecular chaperone DnaK
MADVAVGIDLGTTFSVVAHLDSQGRPWTVSNAEGDLTTPSVVFFDKAAVIVGKQAVKAAEFEPRRVAQFAKRNMGDRWMDRPVCGRRLPPEIVQALVLKKVKLDAERKLGTIDKAVVTVPAYFNEPRRKATQDAGRLAGLVVLDIINEPTAAAIAFGVQQGYLNSEAASQQKETVLVYDLGGGTFDVTLMEIDGQDYRAVATSGDVYLGGIDWDMRIVDFVAEHFLADYGTDPREDAQAWQILLSEAADAKHALSVRDETTIHFSHDGHRLRLPFSRGQFQALTGNLLDRTLLRIQKVLRESKRSWKDVTRLLLVGGSTRMPMVQQMLESESGLKADQSLAPDEAVAHGAAIYAGLLGGNARSPRRGMSVANVNSHDLGVLGIEPDTGRTRRKVLVPRNTTLPTERTATFVTRKEGQANVRVTVIEGGDSTGQNATHIGKCVVTDLPADLPAKSPVDVTFNYTNGGRLIVAARLPGTDCKATSTIHRASGMSEEQLDQWQKRIDSGNLLDEAEDDSLREIEQIPETDDAEPLDLGVLPDLVNAPPGIAPRGPVETDALPAPRPRTPADDDALKDFLKGLGD